MSYTVPAGDDLVLELSSYQVPSGDDIVFNLSGSFLEGIISSLGVIVGDLTFITDDLVSYQFYGGERNTFYSADMSDAVFTSSLSESTTRPLTNLHANLPSVFWRPTASTDGQTLVMDLGFSKACDFMGIGSHNFAFMESVKFQCDDQDDPYFANPITIFEFNHSSYNVITFSSISKRYWRFLFSSCSLKIPQVGFIYVGKSMIFPFSPNLDSEHGNKQYQTTVRETASGLLRTSMMTKGRTRAELTFSNFDDSSKTAWLLMMEKIKGRLNSFFFKGDDDVLRLMHFEDDYIPVKGVRANVNELARLKMCDQMAI